MGMLYGHKWASSFGTGDDGTWLRVLEGITGQQIADGLERCLSRADNWPPDAIEFRKLCLGLSDFIENQQKINGKESPLRIEKKPTKAELEHGFNQLSVLKNLF